MIFQDPFSALDPKWSVEQVVTEPLVTHGEKTTSCAAARSRRCWLGSGSARASTRSGSLSSCPVARRSVSAIARALISSPDLVICDEPVTSLDVSIQAQILKLLSDLKAGLGLTYLLIAHDLAVVRVLADRAGDDVPRQVLRDRAHCGDLRASGTPLHRRPLVGDPAAARRALPAGAGSGYSASRRRRCVRRAVVGSAPAVRTRRKSVPTSGPRCVRWTRPTPSPATSRCQPTRRVGLTGRYRRSRALPGGSPYGMISPAN